MALLLASSTNRLPAVSNSIPPRLPNPEAKVLCTPPGVYSKTLPVPADKKYVARAIDGYPTYVGQPGGKCAFHAARCDFSNVIAKIIPHEQVSQPVKSHSI